MYLCHTFSALFCFSVIYISLAQLPAEDIAGDSPSDSTILPSRRIVLNSGESFTLVCDITSAEEFTIFWFKNGAILKSERVRGSERSVYTSSRSSSSSSGTSEFVCVHPQDRRSQKFILQVTSEFNTTVGPPSMNSILLRIRQVDDVNPYFREYKFSRGLSFPLFVEQLKIVTNTSEEVTSIVRNNKILLRNSDDLTRLEDGDFLEFWTVSSGRPARMETVLTYAKSLPKMIMMLREGMKSADRGRGKGDRNRRRGDRVLKRGGRDLRRGGRVLRRGGRDLRRGGRVLRRGGRVLRRGGRGHIRGT